jgi:hypothetical protein
MQRPPSSLGIDPFASLGCAAENLLLAAAAFDFGGHLSLDPSTSSVAIDLEDALPHRTVLFQAIPSRQCTRTEYDGAKLTAPPGTASGRANPGAVEELGRWGASAGLT